MRPGFLQFGIGLVVGILVTYLYLNKMSSEGFEDGGYDAHCGECRKRTPCGCPKPRPVCPPCREPDMSQYVLKSTIPPCPTCPDMSNYMLKTECPPTPDMSKYILKSSIERHGPIILDCSKCQKPKGDCPPCPRPRCPEVKCAEPAKCAPCAPCARPTCPPPVIKCKAQEISQSTVRPYLAPLSVSGYGEGFAGSRK